MRRLAAQPGEWIDRTRPLGFAFEGRPYSGYAGDTIASALAAAGVRVLGRSFKYHRPRGLYSVANHDVNALMQVAYDGRNVCNVRADVVPVAPGMSVRAVNTVGGVARDRRALLDRLSPFLPVGFYYKAFYSKRWFPRWERLFRDFSGLGIVDLEAPRRLTAKRYDFADVLVIGAGASGLGAALAAADAGAETVLVDENTHPGGSLTYTLRADAAARDKLKSLLAAVERHPRVRCLLSTTAVGYYADHWIALDTPEHLVKLRARAVVVAQGAFEQPAVFRNNDLPGTMLATGAQRLMHQYSVAPATRLVVLTANAAGYRAAQEALAHAIDVRAVLDLRARPGPESVALTEALRGDGVPVQWGAAVREAHAAANGCLARVSWSPWATGDAARKAGRGSDNHGVCDDVASDLDVDGFWVSVGYAPANALLHQAQGRFRYDAMLAQYVPVELPPGVFACGKVNGVHALEARLADGARAGSAAAAYCGHGCATGALSFAEHEPPSHPFPVIDHPHGKNFVDFDEDLEVRDLENAAREGFDSPELMKRYSTVGMGPSQGKHSNMNALRVLARFRGEGLDALGPTTSRPFFHPVPMSHLAGRGFTPERRTPVDAEHERLGAVWMAAGNWRRPEFYSRGGASRATCIAEEVRAVREGVGVIDVGTLGKIEAHGSLAAEFLNRVYTGRFDNLKVGMTRYGLMLDESAVVIDDGVIARLAEETFYFTTTTGNAAAIFRELGRLATWWGMAVPLVNLTGHLAAFNLAGPRSREVLAKLTALDLSHAAFPYLGVREALVSGVPAKLLRVGFVGELGYEIHVPAGSAVRFWHALLEAGREAGIRPFGVEAQRLLRLEKGHLIVGQDTDGVTNALELGVDWALKMDKPFFVGQRSLRILAQQPRKQQLVGFTLAGQPEATIRECHLVIDAGEIAGRVTSVNQSATLDRLIGLALVQRAVARRERFTIRADRGTLVTVDVVPLPFYDATGERQKIGAREPDALAAGAA
jgi:sarcosine oxidase subunit alpha